MKALYLLIDTLTPEIETPVDKCAIELVFAGVFDNDSPFADSRFTPTELSVDENKDPDTK